MTFSVRFAPAGHDLERQLADLRALPDYRSDTTSVPDPPRRPRWWSQSSRVRPAAVPGRGTRRAHA